MTNAEIYTRHVLDCHEGLPCWRPKAMEGTQGIVPGDVGVFDLTKGFRQLFNLWDEDYVRYWQAPAQEIRCNKNHFDEGDHIASGAALESSSMDDE